MLAAVGALQQRLSMTLFALILALILEQLRPLQQHAVVDDWLRRICVRAGELYDDGSFANGRLAWLLIVGASGVLTLLAHFLLLSLHPVFAFAFGAGVLYLALGFRREEGMFTDIQRALDDEDVEMAARRLSDWTGRDHAGADAAELARVAVEHALLTAHRGLYGVLFWFVVLPGPTGVVMYRLARRFREGCGAHTREAGSAFEEFGHQAWEWLDAVPARITAVAFSVIGNFEDALFCWRTQAGLWADHAGGIVLSAGAGALGLRLGMSVHQDRQLVDRPELGLGAVVDVDQMPRVARMIWRVLVLYVLVLALLAIAGWVGR